MLDCGVQIRLSALQAILPISNIKTKRVCAFKTISVIINICVWQWACAREGRYSQRPEGSDLSGARHGSWESPNLVVRDRSQIFYKTSKCSQSMSHLFSPHFHDVKNEVETSKLGVCMFMTSSWSPALVYLPVWPLPMVVSSPSCPLTFLPHRSSPSPSPS